MYPLSPAPESNVTNILGSRTRFYIPIDQARRLRYWYPRISKNR